VNLASVRSLAFELRGAVGEVQREHEQHVGRVVVSGMLAEQLARELGAGADPGAVVVSDRPSVEGAAVVVRVIAGDPSEEDDTLVRAADAAGTPVLFVQLWPQASWKSLFVLTPFVVECEAGKGFPVDVIAREIALAVEHSAALAARVPALKDTVEFGVIRRAMARAALLGVAGAKKGPTRPLITLEQLRMIASLRAAERPDTRSELPPPAVAAAALAAGFALRALADAASRSLPAPLVNPVIAAGGTWALAEVVRRLESRGN
jgi:hypothetical protein